MNISKSFIKTFFFKTLINAKLSKSQNHVGSNSKSIVDFHREINEGFNYLE